MFALEEPSSAVAPRLLGAELRVGPVWIRLTEVEAYRGASDEASHAYRGQTRRNAAMFGPPGTLYCYLSYGLHIAVNIVCREEGVAEAVLLRAGEIVHGADQARQRRGNSVPDNRLARGPGCLGQSLGLTLEDSGRVLDGEGLSLVPAPRAVAYQIGPRVGVSRAADVAWRFWIPGDPTVSAYRRSRLAPDAADTVVSSSGRKNLSGRCRDGDR